LYDPIARNVVRSRDVVFVEDQPIEDTGKTKVKVLESMPVGVPPQRLHQDRNDSNPGLQIQLTKKLKRMLQKMCKMMHIVL
jgi:hypothetical protein